MTLSLAKSLVLPLLALPLAAPVTAQTAKVGRAYYEDVVNGYRFRYIDGWQAVPPQPSEAERGILLKMRGRSLTTKNEYGQRWQFEIDMRVIKLTDEKVRDDEDPDDEGRTVSERLVRRRIADYIGHAYHLDGFEPDEPEVDEEVKVKGRVAHHQRWYCISNSVEVFFDTWTFSFPERDGDLCLVYSAPREHEKKLGKVYAKSARTFEAMDVVVGLSEDDAHSYDELLAYHMEEASRTPGWRALPTPSKKFIIKTSSDDERFIKKVIDRLERSREIFEKDFPPVRPIQHVSIVRVCKNEAEFHQYGNTGGGVAGWFNPSTTELVLYDATQINGAMTFAVMSHEGFHQYCFFLFDRSEAHRWFDEGHGDYYGGFNFDGRKPKVEARMPGGLDRLSEIRQMLREETYTPLAEHLNFDHYSWRNQGPTDVSCYAESWSIIYMLRRGTDGKVPKRVWKKEYADIIPNYVRVLNEGFRKAYRELLAEMEEGAKARGYPLTEEERELASSMLPPERKQEIWDAAIEASWGQIDLDEFQENWLMYVDKYLK